jgi:hypothetical protein
MRGEQGEAVEENISTEEEWHERSWRKLRDEEAFSSSYLIRMVNCKRARLAGYTARVREKKNAHTELVGKSEGKRPLA